MSRPALLSLAIAAALAPNAYAAPAPEQLDRIEVRATAQPDPRFPGVSPTVEEGKVKAGKKSTRVDLGEQPAIVENPLRSMLVRVPGVLVSELREPAYFNMNYRGLGNPHESEFVTALENGVPFASDWFGYPTLYYLPPSGRVEVVEFIRGGSALLYGPQPGPSLNFITRRPRFDAPLSLRSDQVVGADGLYQTFNEVAVGGDRVAFLADFDHRSADGQRPNADYNANAGRAAVAFMAGDNSIWDIEVSGYDTSSGEPGRLTSAQFAADPELAKTPFNRVFIEREALRIGNNTRLNDDWTLHGVYQRTSLDRISRRSSAFVPPQPPPGATNFDRQQFDSHLFDLRTIGDIGEQHTLTAGFTGYYNDSPREQLRSTDIDGPFAGEPVFRQERDSSYAAGFVEAVLRFDRLTLVPALRQEWLRMRIDETLPAPGLARPPIDREFERNETLLGLGAMFELGADQQLYGNVSQGYRPMRFDDIGNPTSALGTQNDPDLAHALNIEFGVRGRPWAGVYYDVSAFRIELDDKIEQRQLGPSDIVRVNTGDSRHQGVEAALEWDVLNPGGDSTAPSLLLFANAALLDAEITRSENPALVGNEPAFAPDAILRGGVLYRSAGGLKAGVTATYVSDHFWQDSNRAGGSAGDPIAAVVPSYTVVDLSVEAPLTRQLALLGGVGNVLDEKYYSRVRSDGIEPAPERTWYLGVSLRF